MKPRNILLGVLLLAYTVLWIGGVGSYIVLPEPPPEAAWAAPAFLFLAGLLIVTASERRTALYLLAAGFLGFFSEVVGVHTGFPFGTYVYTDTVRPILFDVPIVMLTAWIILPAYVLQLLSLLKLPYASRVFTGGALMVMLDLVIDPVAIGPMNFWSWIDTGWYYGIPFGNFLGWLVVSMILFLFLGRINEENRWHRYVGTSIVLFFTCIAFAGGLLMAGAVGVVLVVVQAVLELLAGKRHRTPA